MFFFFLGFFVVCFFVVVLKHLIFRLFGFFYIVRFSASRQLAKTKLDKNKLKFKKKVEIKKKSYIKRKKLTLQQQSRLYNFKFKWLDTMYFFLSTLTNYTNVAKFAEAVEKIAAREINKEWLTLKLKNKERLKKVWRFIYIKNFFKLRSFVFKKKKFLSFRKRYRMWKNQKRQKRLTSFFYRYRKSLFFKKYAYRFKLMQLFFFRYTYVGKKLFFFFAKKRNNWFWTSQSRYLHLEQYFRYQLYYFLKQLFIFKKRRQYSTWDKQIKYFILKFKKLKILLGQHFLKVNGQKIICPFYLVFLYDLLELSYAKFYDQICSLRKKQLNFRSYKLKYFDIHSIWPKNFNFGKRLKKKVQYFFEKKKKNGFFSLFCFLKNRRVRRKYYFKYLSKQLQYFKFNHFYFLYHLYFQPIFQRYQTKHVSLFKRWLKRRKKLKIKMTPLLFKKFLDLRKRTFLGLVNGLFLLRLKSQRAQWTKKKKKKNYIFKSFYLSKKKNKAFYFRYNLGLGLGKFFKFFAWEQRRILKLYKIFSKKQWKIRFRFLKKKKRSTANRWIRKYYKRYTLANSLRYFRKKKRKYFKHNYFIKSKFLKGLQHNTFREQQSLLRRYWLFKKIWFFKQLFSFYKFNRKNRGRWKKKNAWNLIRSSRLLAYIPFRVSRIVNRKRIWRSRFFVLKRRELQLLFFQSKYN